MKYASKTASLNINFNALEFLIPQGFHLREEEIIVRITLNIPSPTEALL